MSDNITHIYTAVLVTLPIAFIALVLRLVARRITKFPLWFDDYLCIMAFIFACGFCTTIFVWTEYFRLGLPIGHLPKSEQDYFFEKNHLMLWLNELTYACSLAFSKLAILSFYWRIFQHTLIRWPIRILLVMTVVWVLLRTFMVIFQCYPVQYIWDKSLPGGGSCPINMNEFFLATILTHCLLDVIILILPILPVVQMHSSWKQKLGIVTLFTAGTIVVMASVFVLVESIKYESEEPEILIEICPFIYWAAVEVNLAIFSSCLPMLKPVFRRVLPTKQSRTTNGFSSVGGVDPIRLSQIKLPGNLESAGRTKIARAKASLGLGRPERTERLPSDADLDPNFQFQLTPPLDSKSPV